MEFLTGIMIAILIFISAKFIANNELEVSNFFSFLAAMMLAYQPVRSLATLNIAIQQGLSGAKVVLPIIDSRPKIKDKKWYGRRIGRGQKRYGKKLAQGITAYYSALRCIMVY